MTRNNEEILLCFERLQQKLKPLQEARNKKKKKGTRK
jgi:hypothetical protein